MLLGRFTRVFAAIVVAAAFVLPGDGTGFVPTCYFKAMFALPCPGCGLSRSLASITHLRFGDAVAYHPFGLVVFLLLCAILAVSLCPARIRAGVAGWLDVRAPRVRRIYMTGVAAFLVFGVGRLVLSGLANGWPSLGG
ncbi:MAG: DUF2752 domain-containing protein [Deltaproteobacteria bacterium]|nr:DUF2752 domain-containing protein [Deltaproteobacteria bacterium]